MILLLTGLPSFLVALGGDYYQSISKLSEEYLVELNKWATLSSLRIGRQNPGAVLLRSKRLFCFCGTQRRECYLNSVESIQLGSESEWKLLPLDNKVALVKEVAVVSLRGRVVLLGDDWLAAPHIQVFSEEGSLIACLPSATFTPGSIKHGMYVMRDGKVYAVGL